MLHRDDRHRARSDLFRDLAVTLFQPAGTGIRIAMLTAPGRCQGPVNWVQAADPDFDALIASAMEITTACPGVAVVAGAGKHPASHLRGVLANCLLRAGFDDLVPGREIAWPPIAVAAE